MFSIFALENVTFVTVLVVRAVVLAEGVSMVVVVVPSAAVLLVAVHISITSITAVAMNVTGTAHQHHSTSSFTNALLSTSLPRPVHAATPGIAKGSNERQHLPQCSPGCPASEWALAPGSSELNFRDPPRGFRT